MCLIPALTGSIAAHYPRHADRDELVQAAALGLVEAALRYDPERGVPFECWATARMRGAVIDAVRVIDFVPRSVRSTSRQIDAVEDELAAKLRRTPTTRELAAALDMSVRALSEHRARRYSGVVLSLDASAQTAEGATVSLGDLLADADGLTPEAAVDEAESVAILREAIRLLPDRLHTVIHGYFVAGRTSLDLAEELGVTESRIAQMRAEGLAMMRHGLAGLMGRSCGGDQAGRRAVRSREAYAAAVAERASVVALRTIPRPRGTSEATDAQRVDEVGSRNSA